MNLSLSEEQAIIAFTASEFLSGELPMARVRKLAENVDSAAIDDATWKRCAELGWFALALPEEAGGAGFGLCEEVMLFREFGRYLAPGPFLSSILGVRVATKSGTSELASSIAAGDVRVGIEVGDMAVNVRPGDLLLAIGDRTAELFEIAKADHLECIDPGSRLARVSRGASVAKIEDQSILDRARVLLAAEQLGIIEAVRDMAASYAQLRMQFGKAIGSFQAVKHRCADMAVAAYSVIGEIYQAALLVDAGAPDGAFHAANAYVLASTGAKTSTADNIQNHGGIGFTWEHDAHLYLKRAFLLENLLGPQRLAYQAILAPARHEFT
jgi:alkylation response protein AidB-like acyl-CoA dehydrogenase